MTAALRYQRSSSAATSGPALEAAFDQRTRRVHLRSSRDASREIILQESHWLSLLRFAKDGSLERFLERREVEPSDYGITRLAREIAEEAALVFSDPVNQERFRQEYLEELHDLVIRGYSAGSQIIAARLMKTNAYDMVQELESRIKRDGRHL